jgi:asparagine synthase (glutamine-hydrolysing)
VRGQEGKFILKKAFEPRLPADVLYRPKMGFSVPLASWLRGPLAQRTRDAVLGARMADSGYFDPKTLQSMVRQHQSGERDFSAPLWTLLMFEAFLRQVETPSAAAGLGAIAA